VAHVPYLFGDNWSKEARMETKIIENKYVVCEEDNNRFSTERASVEQNWQKQL
jgi:hypothetical protein